MIEPRASPRSLAGTTGGFTLLEALLALTLVGLALMLDLGLRAQSREIEARAAAEADLLRRAGAVIESVRAGLHPLRTGPVDASRAWPWPAGPGVGMVLRVGATETAGVCRLVVWGHAAALRGPPHEVELATMVWQPGSPCR